MQMDIVVKEGSLKKRKNKMKEIIKTFVYGMCILSQLLVIKLFYTAYFKTEKAVLLTINTMRGANLEAVLIPVFFILTLFGIWYLEKDKF